MKSDIDIKDDIYAMVKVSGLMAEVKGTLKKTRRSASPKDEDVCISILANQLGDIQRAKVNVNIYVKDYERQGQYEEATIRLRELCDVSKSLLMVNYFRGAKVTLDRQNVEEVAATNEHMINNVLLYEINESI